MAGRIPRRGSSASSDSRLRELGPTGVREATVVLAGGTVALDAVSLLAEPGELLVILGPSGSGKSTLLRAIAGLVPMRSGRVIVNGRDVSDLPIKDRNLSMVFQSASLVPFLDVAGNLGWGMQARHVPRAEIDERVEKSARSLHLGRLLHRMPTTLSAGERGMVGIGRAFSASPSAFLLDEPLAHLDAAERWRMRRQLVEIVRRSGVAMLYVTHEQSDALAIGDRVALIADGSVVQVDTPRGLYARPATLFAASFVAAEPMGLVPARVVQSQGLGGFRVGARTLPLWAPLPPALAGLIGHEVVLGFRPEDVGDAGPQADPEAVTLPGTVLAVENTGREAFVAVRLPVPAVTTPGAEGFEVGGTWASLRARFSAHTAARVGDPVSLVVDATRAHVFDRLTGLALCHPPLVARSQSA